MLAKGLLVDILDDDALTRGLADPEARVLVEWLVDQADRVAGAELDANRQLAAVKRLCRRGRAISRIVALWCHRGEHGAAIQLVASERCPWPLPDADVEPFDLMQAILMAEGAEPVRAV